MGQHLESGLGMINHGMSMPVILPMTETERERLLAAAWAKAEDRVTELTKERDCLLAVIRAVINLPNMTDLEIEQLRQTALDVAKK